MKRLLALVVLLLIIIGSVYTYATSSNIEVSEDTKYSIEHDTKLVGLKNNTNKKILVQVKIINDVKTTFGNYMPMSTEYQEIILGPKEEKTLNIIQYHTRKVRYEIVKEVELEGGE